MDRRSLLCAKRQWNDRQRSQEFLSSRVSPLFPFIYRCRWAGAPGALSMPRTSTAGWSPRRWLSSLVSARVAGFLFCYCCCRCFVCFVFNLSVCMCLCVWACKRVLDSCVYCITIYKTKTKTKISLGCVEIQKICSCYSFTASSQVHTPDPQTHLIPKEHTCVGPPNTKYPAAAHQTRLRAWYTQAGRLTRPPGAAGIDKASNYLRTKKPRVPCGGCASMNC